MKNNTNKQYIFPFGFWYFFIIILTTIVCLGGGIFAFVYTLCGQGKTGSLLILKKFSPTNCIIEAFIWLIALVLIFYFAAVRMYLSDIIIFKDNKIKKTTRFMSFSGKIPAFELNCSDINSARLEVGIYVYLILSTVAGKEYKIFIRPFSRKQILKIVTMINERGGQIDIIEIKRFLKEEYLFGKRKVKQKKE